MSPTHERPPGKEKVGAAAQVRAGDMKVKVAYGTTRLAVCMMEVLTSLQRWTRQLFVKNLGGEDLIVWSTLLKVVHRTLKVVVTTRTSTRAKDGCWAPIYASKACGLDAWPNNSLQPPKEPLHPPPPPTHLHVSPTPQAFSTKSQVGISEWLSGRLELPPGGIKDSESVTFSTQIYVVAEGQPNALELAIAMPQKKARRARRAQERNRTSIRAGRGRAGGRFCSSSFCVLVVFACSLFECFKVAV